MSSCAVLALLSLAVLGAGAQAAAPPSNAQKQELKALRNRIDTLQKTLAASEETKHETVDALRESERAISESNRLLRGLTEDQRTVNARLADLREQNQRTTGDLEAQRTRLARLLYQQYTGGQPDALKLLLNRDDPNRIAREIHYLTYLARARAELITSLRTNLGRISDVTQQTQQQSAELAAINAAQQAQRQRLESEKAARKVVDLALKEMVSGMAASKGLVLPDRSLPAQFHGDVQRHACRRSYSEVCQGFRRCDRLCATLAAGYRAIYRAVHQSR